MGSKETAQGTVAPSHPAVDDSVYYHQPPPLHSTTDTMYNIKYGIQRTVQGMVLLLSQLKNPFNGDVISHSVM